jgi:hypothetical protein
VKRLLVALLLAIGIAPALAQAPPPVPALPDTQRVTSYSITASTCTCAVGFQIYGDGTDYQNWLTVSVEGAVVAFTDPTFGWAITSPTGPLGSIARPITDAVLTFNNPVTGGITITGNRRPRRTSQFPENRGVAARDFNVVLTDIIAENREQYDKIINQSGTGISGLVVGTTVVTGGANNGLLVDGSGVLQTTGPTLGIIANPTANGQWQIGATATRGAIVIGQGSTNDFTLENKLGAAVIAVPTGTGHVALGAGTPTANACAGFALGTGSSDVAGRVTCTSASSCAINFGQAFTNAPFCTVMPGSAASTVSVTTTTGILTASFGTAQTAMMYHCLGG